ncbi:MAG TPA: hypothetical protein VKR06_16510 [Ktedonosporobacter sp.]|nr:hypothetical protein [Ktedonosporobacter sp.]
MRTHAILLILPLFLLLTGCSDSTASSQSLSPSVAAKPLNTVDWSNSAYPVSCAGGVHNFQARGGQANDHGIHFEVYANKAVYGDLTAAGQTQAVIPYSCTAADFGGVRTLIMTGDSSNRVIIGDLPLPAKAKTDNTLKDADTIVIKNGEVSLSGRGYSSSAPHCCPDLQMTQSYRWDGKQFVLSHSTATKLSTH